MITDDNDEDLIEVAEPIPLEYAKVDTIEPAPIPMILHCPACAMQHIDTPDPTKGWFNPPHKSHQCQNPDCGFIWRVADVYTTGVASVERGSHDTVVDEVHRRTMAYELIAHLRHTLADVTTRRDELLHTIAHISREAPLPGETLELRGQVATLVAEVGSLRAQVQGMSRDCGADRNVLSRLVIKCRTLEDRIPKER